MAEWFRQHQELTAISVVFGLLILALGHFIGWEQTAALTATLAIWYLVLLSTAHAIGLYQKNPRASIIAFATHATLGITISAVLIFFGYGQLALIAWATNILLIVFDAIGRLMVPPES